MTRTTLAVTMGDPAGIGPEIILKALRHPADFAGVSFIVVGSPPVFSQTAAALNFSLDWPTVSERGLPDLPAGTVAILQPSAIPPGPFTPGALSAQAGLAALRAIETATDLAMTHVVDAIVTPPLNKEAIALAGSPHPGHTEFLQTRTRAANVVMMLCSDKLRVSLLTIHQSLASAVASISTPGIVDCIRITDDHLRRWFAIPRPRLAVAGLNPHAGESGLFGDEEDRLIRPAVLQARSAGSDCVGPLPPDTVFLRALRDEFDAVVCMYHDQGLIPIKLLSFGQAVNVTLGLPIVRTSVDHGTAFDIAGKGVASPSSLVGAIRLAASIVRNLRSRE